MRAVDSMQRVGLVKEDASGLKTEKEIESQQQFQINKLINTLDEIKNGLSVDRQQLIDNIKNDFIKIFSKDAESAGYADVSAAILKGEGYYEVVKKFAEESLIPLYKKLADIVYDESTPYALRVKIVNAVGKDVLRYRVIMENYSQDFLKAVIIEDVIKDVYKQYVNVLNQLTVQKELSEGQKAELIDEIDSLNKWLMLSPAAERYLPTDEDRTKLNSKINEEENMWRTGRAAAQKIDETKRADSDFIPDESVAKQQNFKTDLQNIKDGTRQKKLEDDFKNTGKVAAIVSWGMGERYNIIEVEDEQLLFKTVEQYESYIQKKIDQGIWKREFRSYPSLYDKPNTMGWGKALSTIELKYFEEKGIAFVTYLFNAENEELVGRGEFNAQLLKQDEQRGRAYIAAQKAQIDAMEGDNFAVQMRTSSDYKGFWDKQIVSWTPEEIIAVSDPVTKLPKLNKYGFPIMFLQPLKIDDSINEVLIDSGIELKGARYDEALALIKESVVVLRKDPRLITVDAMNELLQKKGLGRFSIKESQIEEFSRELLTKIQIEIGAYRYINGNLKEVNPDSEDVKFIVKSTIQDNDPETGDMIIFGKKALERELSLATYSDFLTRWKISRMQESIKKDAIYNKIDPLLSILGSITNYQTVAGSRLIMNLWLGLGSLGIKTPPKEKDIQQFFENKFGKDDFAKFKDFITKAPATSDPQFKEELYKHIQKEMDINTDTGLEYARFILYTLDNLAEVFNMKRDDELLLKGFWQYFGGTELNLNSIVGDMLNITDEKGVKYFGRGMTADVMGMERLFSSYGFTLDVMPFVK
ncbi:MAG: hypothetical protein KAJ14_12980, partial [Candidatus Omnitrophica bacterium]|nr:hypothetical protein [Candidatus Omnitrophota bacterium]